MENDLKKPTFCIGRGRTVAHARLFLVKELGVPASIASLAGYLAELGAITSPWKDLVRGSCR